MLETKIFPKRKDYYAFVKKVCTYNKRFPKAYATLEAIDKEFKHKGVAVADKKHWVRKIYTQADLSKFDVWEYKETKLRTRKRRGDEVYAPSAMGTKHLKRRKKNH